MAKKILIVDDDQQIVLLIGARLRANQYEIVVANDAVQAISKARMEKPDLILLDNRMSGGSGLSVLATLRQRMDTILTPIILITAYPSEKIKEEAMEKGATDFIGKPFDANDLLGKIRKAFGEKDL